MVSRVKRNRRRSDVEEGGKEEEEEEEEDERYYLRSNTRKRNAHILIAASASHPLPVKEEADEEGLHGNGK